MALDKSKRALLAPALLVVVCACAGAPAPPSAPQAPYDSGGPLLPEQAAFDVRHYELTLKVLPDERALEGEVIMRARALVELRQVVLDLDPLFEVTEVRDVGRSAPATFEWRGPRLWIELEEPVAAGDELAVAVAYRGRPREAPLPPWEGGFSWSETAAGEPWVGVSCQVDGADIWWPCKDHPSDEPDEGVSLHFTVPEPLVCVSNGRLEGLSEADEEGWWTSHWVVSAPINTYDVTVNLAPYEAVERAYTSVSGDELAVTWWALPESTDRAAELLSELVRFLRFLEQELGPYPFRADKLAVVDTPYLAMEHQTAIALGLDGDVERAGFPYILLHELTHEWWGNLVSASDWRDFWLHEGFTGFIEARYAERLHGRAKYHEYMERYLLPGLRNRLPVAPRQERSLRQVFVKLDGHEHAWDVDSYAKGAWVLHSLRYLLGDETFFEVLRRWAYPEPRLESVTDGSHCRSVSTADFERHVEALSGRDLGWFFDCYLRQPALPRLDAEVRAGELRLRWSRPAGVAFEMPVEVIAGDDRLRVEMPTGEGSIPWPHDAEPLLDPDHWILRDRS